MPPPVRRIVIDGRRANRCRCRGRTGRGRARTDGWAAAPITPRRRSQAATHQVRGADAGRGAERSLTGRKLAVRQVSPLGEPGRGARADRALGLWQDYPAPVAQPARVPDPYGSARSGRITLDGESTSARSRSTELRRRVGMVFQQPNPFPMSVFDNVAYGLRERGQASPVVASAQPQLSRIRSSAPVSTRRSRQPLPPRYASLRRPAAAPLHRPLASGAAPRCYALRALLGALPAARRRRSRS